MLELTQFGMKDMLLADADSLKIAICLQLRVSRI